MDDPQTVELLQSMRLLMEWLRSRPPKIRRQFLETLAECDDETQGVVLRMVSIVENPSTTPVERQRALATITDALSLNEEEGHGGQDPTTPEAGAATARAMASPEAQGADCQQAVFAGRLRELMTARCITQQELAERVGCSQPAISQMLNRACRPQKKTILKLAEALQVEPHELWPDIQVVEMLDAVASFQQEDYVMTDAEAEALGGVSHRNAPKIPVRPLPTRQR